MLEKIPSFALKILATFLGPFRFEVTYLSRNPTFLPYINFSSDLATNDVSGE